MRKPDFWLGNREADQRVYLRYTDSTNPSLLKSEISSFCDCTGQFLSDLVGNPEDRFCSIKAHIKEPLFYQCFLCC